MEYHNWGRNGSCIAYEWKTEQFGPPLYERYADLPDTADYVIVIGGHNDAVLMHRYGEGTEFFRSKLDILCAGLKQKFPTTKICFQGPNDMAHLNAKGHDLFLPRIEPFLLGL